MKANYHTHTSRCMHAAGNDEDYVLSAVKGGYDILGFSDHTPWKYNSDYVATMRMKLSELSGYLKSIRALKDKYKDKITVLAGLECEYFPDYMGWLYEMSEKENIEYLIFGNHFYLSDETGGYYGGTHITKEGMLEQYVTSTIKGMETGLYSYLAHPDLFMRSYPEFDQYCEEASKEICKRAKQLHMPLEYNLAGMLYNEANHINGYPEDEFWKIAAKEGNDILIGVDAHHYKHLETKRYRKKAETFLESIAVNLIDEIPMRADL